MTYIVTSKPGMCPFSHPATGKEALADSRAAKVQGLDGEICVEDVSVCPECSGDPMQCECITPLSDPPLTDLDE